MFCVITQYQRHIPLFTHSLAVDLQVLSSLGLLGIKLSINIGYRHLCEHQSSALPDPRPGAPSPVPAVTLTVQFPRKLSDFPVLLFAVQQPVRDAVFEPLAAFVIAWTFFSFFFFKG